MDDYFGVKTKTLNSERLDNDERRALTVMKFPVVIIQYQKK